MKRVAFDDLSFYLDPRLDTSQLQNSLLFIDELLDDGPILKDSRTTTAGVVELSGGQRVFIKRENNKGWYFSAKYLFRRSRVFRAARAAALLEKLGIPTPQVLGVGSRRRMGVLKSGYLLTETFDRVLTTESLCHYYTEDQGFHDNFIASVCGFIALMHDHGIRHGDLKLSNIYCMEAPDKWIFGLWDLDGTIKYPSALPQFLRTLEVARIVSSLIKAMTDNNIASAPSLDAVVADFEIHYNHAAGQKVNAVAIGKATRRYLSRYGLTPPKSVQ